MAEAQTSPETFAFQADVKQLLQIVVHSLYSNKEIFLRELVSNASDALDKLKFRSLTEHDILGEEKDLEVRVAASKEAKTLTIEDTGVGMTREELVKNLGTLAHSGTRAFLDKVKEKGGQGQSALQLIGQFGLGFYSSFLVADRVTVVSRAAGSTEAWKWTSDAHGEFTVEPAVRAARGTEVTLHVREEQKEFLDEWKLRELITRYSDYVNHPIKLLVEKEEDAKIQEPGATEAASDPLALPRELR
ncbi:MAG TPA: ATP-binding protein, partial [Planctomycetota bacterium]|nr:ATP-binding protein [Planctomycetota bacterium]